MARLATGNKFRGNGSAATVDTAKAKAKAKATEKGKSITSSIQLRFKLTA